ncbi:MAG: FAD-dependent oxidoreductase [bacterium]
MTQSPGKPAGAADSVLVVGGGIAGLTAASALADLGVGVTLVEREVELGGHAAEWACMATDACARCSACLVQDQLHRVLVHPKIRVVTGAQVSAIEGGPGHFRLDVAPVKGNGQNGRKGPTQLRLRSRYTEMAGCVVLATGFGPFDPTLEPLLGYGRFPGVMTTRELDRALRQDDLNALLSPEAGPQRVAFIQCVGSRDRERGREYCSQFCCRTTIRLVRRLRYLRPEIEPTVFYIDLQLMSKEFSTFFEEARRFVRFVQGVPAEISPGDTEGSLRVYSAPSGAEKTEAFDFDRVVLAVGMAPPSQQPALVGLFGLEVNGFGHVASDALGETSRPGILAIGACVGPTDIQSSCKRALAAASHAATLLRTDASGHDATSRGHHPPAVGIE